jgi:hypothetical protein
MDKLETLIKALQDFAPDTLNGAVIFHMDKTTKSIIKISPVTPNADLQELFYQLATVRDGIQYFLNDLVDRGLAKN